MLFYPLLDQYIYFWKVHKNRQNHAGKGYMKIKYTAYSGDQKFWVNKFLWFVCQNVSTMMKHNWLKKLGIGKLPLTTLWCGKHFLKKGVDLSVELCSKMNGAMYEYILQNYYQPYWRKNCGHNYLFQLDNGPGHTFRKVF